MTSDEAHYNAIGFLCGVYILQPQPFCKVLRNAERTYTVWFKIVSIPIPFNDRLTLFIISVRFRLNTVYREWAKP